MNTVYIFAILKDMQNEFGLETHPNPIYMEPPFREGFAEHNAAAEANATAVAQWWLEQHPELLGSPEDLEILVKSIADDLEWPRSDVYQILNSIPGIEVFDPYAQYRQELADRQKLAEPNTELKTAPAYTSSPLGDKHTVVTFTKAGAKQRILNNQPLGLAETPDAVALPQGASGEQQRRTSVLGSGALAVLRSLRERMGLRADTPRVKE